MQGDYYSYYMANNYLAHHGVLGMKWGQHIFGKIKSALSSRKKKKQNAKNLEKAREAKVSKKEQQKQLEAKKNAVLKSRSAKKLYDNASLFSDEELKSAYNRLQLEANIASLAPKTKSRGQRYAETALFWIGTAGNVMKKGTEAYNAYVDIYNTVQETANSKDRLPKIKHDWDDEDKKK